MAEWIEIAKRIYKESFKGTEDGICFLMTIERKCDEKGYSIEETKKVIDYVRKG